MRLLDKYIGSEVASHALLGLAVFTFVFFVPQLVRLMDLVVRHSGGVFTVLTIFLCSLTPVLAFTVPMAVLVGVRNQFASFIASDWFCRAGLHLRHAHSDVLGQPRRDPHPTRA